MLSLFQNWMTSMEWFGVETTLVDGWKWSFVTGRLASCLSYAEMGQEQLTMSLIKVLKNSYVLIFFFFGNCVDISTLNWAIDPKGQSIMGVVWAWLKEISRFFEQIEFPFEKNPGKRKCQVCIQKISLRFPTFWVIQIPFSIWQFFFHTSI